MPLSAVAATVGGRLASADPGAVVTGPVVIDSREAADGVLFAAFAGEREDGHDYAPQAVASGAVAALTERAVDGAPCVVVDDVQVSLGVLGHDLLDRLSDVVTVAVTGSSGKTSTKDLLAQLLARLGPTVAARGSYNNDIGLPLTVLRADASSRHLVLEMGARGPGHIAALCRLAPPQIGVVLNVGSAHVGEFGSREAIARAKGELVDALPVDGLAVLNADDALVTAMASRSAAPVVTFGESDGADVRAADVAVDDTGRPSFTLGTPEGSAPVVLHLFGRHHVSNALAAAAVARHLGMSPEQIAAGLGEAVAASRWRMEVTRRGDGLTVVNDAYNANPESVRAALETLVVMGRAGLPGGGRTWAVLGEMRELGDSAEGAHHEVGRLAARLGVSRLVAVGEGARAIDGGAAKEDAWRGESTYVPDIEAATSLLQEQLRPDDVVLIKASRAVGLERLAAALAGDDA